MLACDAGKPHCVRALLEEGAPVNTVDGGGRTALFIACTRQCFACVDMLLAAGADPDVAEAESGMAPLHVSCELGDFSCVRLLASAGAATENKNKRGDTALLLATMSGHVECIHALAIGSKQRAYGPHGWAWCPSYPPTERYM